jgi:processive 1,2-diacylglycerol beta-glucosyltransferase
MVVLSSKPTMRVLILSSSTGGGHNTRARAFTAWTQKFPELGVSTHQHQTLEEQHGLYHFGVEVYNSIQKRAPRLHHIYFNYLEVAGMFSSEKKIFSPQRFVRVLEEEQPEAILSVHGSLNHGFFQMARRTLGRDRVRCVTYCGELYGGYGFSRHWVNPDADLFIGAVEETRDAAREWGMADEKSRVGGFLLDPSFYEARLTAEEKKRVITEELGLNPNEFILMLATGEVGANNHVAFLKALAEAGLALQVVALCGRNAKSLAAVEAWAKAHPEFRIKALPFTKKMAVLLQCVSAVVARPGTGTTSESILSECPVIGNGVGGIMPQEGITVKFGLKHDITEVIRRPAELPAVVQRWIEQPERREQIKANMRKVRPVQQPRQILEWVMGRS